MRRRLLAAAESHGKTIAMGPPSAAVATPPSRQAISTGFGGVLTP